MDVRADELREGDEIEGLGAVTSIRRIPTAGLLKNRISLRGEDWQLVVDMDRKLDVAVPRRTTLDHLVGKYAIGMEVVLKVNGLLFEVGRTYETGGAVALEIGERARWPR